MKEIKTEQAKETGKEDRLDHSYSVLLCHLFAGLPRERAFEEIHKHVGERD